jgi:predicted porin
VRRAAGISVGAKQHFFRREIIMLVARPQKKLLAAAVACACAVPALALAQVPAGIQIYGRVNVSYEYITIDPPVIPGDKKESWELVDNSSRIGVRGRRDLGGGLAGFFQVESRVKLDDSTGSVFASRDSYAGLQGGWGTLRAGRTIGPVYYATYDYISMHNHDTGTSSDALLAPTVVGNQGFMDNTLWYTSPKFGAITVDVAFSRLGEARVAPGQEQPSHLGLVGSYDQGPIHVSASFANTKKSDLLGPGVLNDDKAYTIGGLYDMKTFVVGALFESAESKTTTQDAKRNYFRVAVMMPVGKQEFHVNYGNVDHRLDQKLNDDGASQFTLFYNYNITKETKVYAFYTSVSNDTNGNYGFRPSPDGADNKSFGVGVRHNF